MGGWYGRSPLWEAVNVRNLTCTSTFRNGIDRGRSRNDQALLKSAPR